MSNATNQHRACGFVTERAHSPKFATDPIGSFGFVTSDRSIPVHRPAGCATQADFPDVAQTAGRARTTPTSASRATRTMTL